MKGPLLEASGLRVSYNGRTVVEVDRLTLERGEVVAVLGPNGSGKSTLFRLLLALQKPQAGTVSLDGERLEPGSRARGRMAGVFQHPYLFAGTVRDNVRYGPRARRADRSRIDTLLGELGLLELAERAVGQLSGGEMQRVALARALACEPDLLLLDEPSASLDVMTQRRLREDLARVVRARSLSLLLITHDPDDAFTLADRIAVMESGRIVQTGTPLELMLDPLNAFVAAFTGAELLLNGVVESHDEGLAGVRIDRSFLLWSTQPAELPVGTPVQVSYQPDDVALSPLNSGYESSARNNFELAVERVTYAGALARIALAGPPRLAAVITRRSAHDLALQPGQRVTAHIKAAALRAFAVSAP